MIGRWLLRLFLTLNDRFKPKHPYAQYFNLKLGQVKGYGRIVPKDQVVEWQAKGWVEALGFSTFGHRPEPDEVFVFGTPQTLMDIEPSTLIGRKIVGYGGGGWYGMGSPGYFGLMLHDNDSVSQHQIALLYAVSSASNYTLVDGRNVICYYPPLDERFHPWVLHYPNEQKPNWDALLEITRESEITAVDLADDQLTLSFEKDGKQHTIEFVKNDPRLAPYWNGVPVGDAFDTGVIRERFIFQELGAVLFGW